MLTISAGEFKAKCLKLMNIVAQNHEEYIITKRGIPIAKIVPIEQNLNPFGFLSDTISYTQDLSELETSEHWEVNF